MAFWNTDLTTQDGAESAAQAGGTAAFVAAGLVVLGIGVQVMGRGAMPQEELIGAIVAMAIECAVFIVAGFRLRAGKGLVWGGITALLLVIEAITKLVTFVGLPGLVVNVILLVVIINGVRGAWALRNGGLDTEAVGQIFE